MKAIDKRKRNRLWLLPGLIVAVLLILVLMIMLPWNYSNLASHPHPAQSYAEAVQRIDALKSAESTGMNPLCQVQFMTHAKKVERAIILVHGYTNCPQQFHDLGQKFYDLGYNVLIAPMPHHGLADRMTEDHALLTAEELAVYTDETVDIAQGLGDKVTMMGLSMGGVITAWAAQNRSDLDLAVVISPAFGFKAIPTPLTAAVMNIYSLLPDAFVWWNPDEQINTPPDYAYPRYSRHALVQALRLGYATQASIQSKPLAAKKLVYVSNANDTSVNNELTAQVVKSWQARGANLSTYEFPSSLKLGHDLIDPHDENQKIDVVYPKLIELTNQ